jgi:hypothetical protein
MAGKLAHRARLSTVALKTDFIAFFLFMNRKQLQQSQRQGKYSVQRKQKQSFRALPETPELISSIATSANASRGY